MLVAIKKQRIASTFEKYIWLRAKTAYLISGGTFAYTLGYTPALKIAIKNTTAPNINY